MQRAIDSGPDVFVTKSDRDILVTTEHATCYYKSFHMHMGRRQTYLRSMMGRLGMAPLIGAGLVFGALGERLPAQTAGAVERSLLPLSLIHI